MGIILAALAWGAMLAQFIVRPFYERGEELHKEYKRDGLLDSFFAKVDSETIIPTLTAIFDRAIELQDDRRRKPEISSLLVRAEFIAELEIIEVAMRERSQVELLLGSLINRTGRIWKLASGHVLSLIAAAALLQFEAESVDLLGSLEQLVGFVGVILLSALLFVWLCVELVRFRADRRNLASQIDG